MNELIEKLKDNDAHRIFADMTPEEQACLKAMGQNLECLGSDMIWYAKEGRLFDNSVYRIKSNYQPQPEYMDYPVATFESGGERWLGIFRGTVNAWTHLHCLPSLPGFRGFLDELNIWIEGDKVAECIANGSKVIVRFENLCPR